MQGKPYFRLCSSPSLLSCSLDELRKLLLQNGYSSGLLNYDINDVLVNRQQNRPKQPITTVPKKEVFLILPYLGLQSRILTKQVKACINKCYGWYDLRVFFQSHASYKSFFPYKDRLTRSHMSRFVDKASCWYCQDFYIGKIKRRLHDRKTEYFKLLRIAITHLLLPNMSRQLVIKWNGTNTKFWQEDGRTHPKWKCQQ